MQSYNPAVNRYRRERAGMKGENAPVVVQHCYPATLLTKLLLRKYAGCGVARCIMSKFNLKLQPLAERERLFECIATHYLRKGMHKPGSTKLRHIALYTFDLPISSYRKVRNRAYDKTTVIPRVRKTQSWVVIGGKTLADL